MSELELQAETGPGRKFSRRQFLGGILGLVSAGAATGILIETVFKGSGDQAQQKIEPDIAVDLSLYPEIGEELSAYHDFFAGTPPRLLIPQPERNYVDPKTFLTQYDPKRNSIRLNPYVLDISRFNPSDLDSLTLALRHNLGKALYLSATTKHPNWRAARKLIGAHHRLAQAEAKYPNLVGFFDETKYVMATRWIGDVTGSPADTFASALNIMRTNPGLFEQVYFKVPPQELPFVSSVRASTLELVESLRRANGLPGDAARQLLPQWDKLKTL